ncbi:hypothetical protein VNO78_09445 [Psophocarpus tetragonolobus]|uniref:Uncharacterized protein n=1 Tax=Psophocarpus tetragonolobus TaxID=3891 RepID=A0AAN9SXH6_PSOTE
MATMVMVGLGLLDLLVAGVSLLIGLTFIAFIASILCATAFLNNAKDENNIKLYTLVTIVFLDQFIHNFTSDNPTLKIGAKRIRRLQGLESRWSHVYNEGNEVARALAKHVLSLNLVPIFFHSCLDLFKNLVKDDLCQQTNAL